MKSITFASIFIIKLNVTKKGKKEKTLHDCMTDTWSLKYPPLQSLVLLAAVEFGRICNSELIKYKLLKVSLETLQ